MFAVSLEILKPAQRPINVNVIIFGQGWLPALCQMPRTNCSQVFSDNQHRYWFKSDVSGQSRAKSGWVSCCPEGEGVEELEGGWQAVHLRDGENVAKEVEFVDTRAVARGITERGV